jgi:4-alpha-glucanotransferase
MPFQRSSGILLHPTSLPSRGGIGDLGPSAHEFLGFLADARQTLWQVLPLGPVGIGNSPYSSTSTFAGNALLVSLDRLAEHGWISPDRLQGLPGDSGPVDYEQVMARKLPLLREAAGNFVRAREGASWARFEQFRDQNRFWLEDYVLFENLRWRYGESSWNQWPVELARREASALERAHSELREDLEISAAIQFALFEQWRSLHSAARARGIKIIGDIAIFVSYDSADVWTHPDIFQLDSNLEPTAVAGVPPDAFSVTGQRWGNPLYRWDVLRARGYDWWIERVRWALTTCDILRLDHFRGFEKYWAIPANEETAVNGRWLEGPKDDLFHALARALGGELPFIAEDLGFITPEVHALRERLRIPGMRVMQFGFGDPGAHIYLPHRFEKNAVVYTGTHDNDTMAGWWRSWATENERRAASAYLGLNSSHDGGEIAWAFVRAAEASVADLCVIPMQDVLGLGSEARMNTPSRSDGNWTWRCAHPFPADVAARLAEITTISDRDSALLASGQQSNREGREDFAA